MNEMKVLKVSETSLREFRKYWESNSYPGTLLTRVGSHFGAPPASRRAGRDASFTEIWDLNQLDSKLAYRPDLYFV